MNVALEKPPCPTHRHSTRNDDVGIQSTIGFLLASHFLFHYSFEPAFPSCYHLYGRLDCFAAVFLLFTDNDLPPWKENKAHRERVISFSSHLLQSVVTRYQEFSLEFFLLGCSQHSKIIQRSR